MAELCNNMWGGGGGWVDLVITFLGLEGGIPCHGFMEERDMLHHKTYVCQTQTVTRSGNPSIVECVI